MTRTWIEDGAAALVATWRAAGDEVTSVDFAIARHLDWLTAARERGLRWTSIARLLAESGLTRPNGEPLLRSHISAVYSRQQRAARNRAREFDRAHPTAPQAQPARTPNSTSHPSESRRRIGLAPAPLRPVGAEVRATMARAAQARKSLED